MVDSLCMLASVYLKACHYAQDNGPGDDIETDAVITGLAFSWSRANWRVKILTREGQKWV